MNIETNRLNTFTNWPSSAPVDPIRIAKAGFFYTGEGTEVQCFSCGGKISEWNYGDQVMWRHRQMEPNCAFVMHSQRSGNVPLVLGRECPNADTSSVTLSQEPPDSTQSPQDYGLREEDAMYKNDSLRLLSFLNWDDTSVAREALVSAGFYHIGEGRLRCAWCGGELAPFRNFGSLGRPLDVHRMYFPRCAHAMALEARQRTSNISPPASPPSYSPQQTPPDTTNQQPQSSGAAHNERILAAGGAWCSLGVVGGGARNPSYSALATGNSSPLGRSRGEQYFPRCAHAMALEARQRTSNISPPASPPSYSPQQTPPDTTNQQPQSSGAAHNERLLAAGGTWRSLGVVGGGARNPSYSALAARLASFNRWPADRTQTPIALAEAGFFYTGTDDQVRCFYCDGGLGRWEAGDAPWWEHAHWFPHCGYVMLMKGQRYVDSCRAGSSVQRTRSAESGLTTRRRNQSVNFPVTAGQVEECMESEAALAALGAGLDAARVRRAILRRLRATGLPFSSSEALIDAVLDEQLNEEAWSVSPQSQRLARDILAETLRDFAPRSGIIPSSQEDSSDSPALSPTPTPNPTPPIQSSILAIPQIIQTGQPDSSDAPTAPDSSRTEPNITEPSEVPKEREKKEGSPAVEKKLTLEEENRQLREARLCKVCMDSEVSVVFLPCGHLVSCGGCGAALSACPLCRCAVRALVRAYLA